MDEDQLKVLYEQLRTGNRSLEVCRVLLETIAFRVYWISLVVVIGGGLVALSVAATVLRVLGK